MWPTEPAKAGWSFNKWQKTKLRRSQLPLHHLSSRHRKDHARAVALAAAAVPEDVAVAAGADVVAPAVVEQVAVVEPADRVEAARGARAVSAAEEAETVRGAIAMADAATVEASSLRT